MPIAKRHVPPKVSRRKQRYNSDAEFRERTKRISRTSYRRKNATELQSCLYSLKFLNEAATDREVVLPDKSIKVMPVFSVTKTAAMLQKMYQTLWRWVEAGMVPKPVLKLPRSPNRTKQFPVYHREEVRALVQIIGEHEENVSYVRRDHAELRMRIEQRIRQVRQKLKIN